MRILVPISGSDVVIVEVRSPTLGASRLIQVALHGANVNVILVAVSWDQNEIARSNIREPFQVADV